MISPSEFRRRLARALPQPPEELGLEVPTWTLFSPSKVEALSIGEASKAILKVSGLPEEVPPFLTFDHSELPTMDQLAPAALDLGHLVVLGASGAGDPICLDTRDGRVVCREHESPTVEHLVNSSVVQLAETLCLFAESTSGGQEGLDFLDLLGRVDPAASTSDSMWPREHRNWQARR